MSYDLTCTTVRLGFPTGCFKKNMIETNSDSKKVMLFLKKMQDLENNRKGLADYLLKSKKELEIKTSKKIIESS
jgi:hypothetical protein